MKPKKIENLQKAFNDLQESLKQPVTENRDLAGIIKTFEIVFELSWKVMQDRNAELGNPSNGPREALERAFEHQLIHDDLAWVEALKDRNLTVHTYDHDFAKQMVDRIKNRYKTIIQKFIENLALKKNG